MINEAQVKKYCSEDISKIENYEQAVNDKTQTRHCHHRREIDENKSRVDLIAEKLYWNQPANELILLTIGEHRRLHGSGEKNNWFGKFPWNKGKHLPDETRKKLSMSRSGEKHPMFGKHHSAETKKKMSDKIIDMKWWNNGAINKRSKECPGQGWVRGRTKNF